MSARGGMYLGRMDGNKFTFAKESLCLVLFSDPTQDGQDPRAVDREACTPLINEACTPKDITFSFMTSMSISLMEYSTALSYLYIDTHG
jgi:hypothetical protein